MRNIYSVLLILIGLLILSEGCNDDFLDRPPKDQVGANYFFKTAKELEVASNDFYSMLSPENVYKDDQASDNIVPLNPSSQIRGSRIVPTDRGSGGWSWAWLRNINYFLTNYHKCDDVDARAKYSGIARFFRAYFYFNKVKRFGDVPWYSRILPANDSGLYKARDSRQLVMDSVMADINYAIDNIPAEKKLNKITKYTALALKARIALYEGTFRKYHHLSGGYKQFLSAASDASNKLIKSGVYKLYTAGGPEKDYRNLFARNDQDEVETILAADYEQGIISHNIGYMMTSPTMGAWGMTKDLINSYLMEDGSKFTDKPDYKTIGYYQEMQNRDPRLTQTTAGPDFIVKGESKPEPIDLSITTTGYRVIKALPPKDQWGTASYFDIIMFRYAEVLLVYAEAKAELDSITQADLDVSVNKLRDRVGMPHMDLVTANAKPDSFLENMYPNVDKGHNEGVILEIRRERRVEMFNEGLRWDDLMRWKEGKKIEQPMVGIYFPHLGAFDFNNDGIPDVYIYDGDASGTPNSVTSKINIQERELRDPITGTVGGTKGNLDPFPQGGTFDVNRDYFYPIPQEDLKLNPKLKQNPYW